MFLRAGGDAVLQQRVLRGEKLRYRKFSQPELWRFV